MGFHSGFKGLTYSHKHNALFEIYISNDIRYFWNTQFQEVILWKKYTYTCRLRKKTIDLPPYSRTVCI